MTRFARAKGSKASNEKVEEKATSWQEMKQQLVQKKKDVEDSKKRKVFEEQRKENYKNFLEEREIEKKDSWAEFEVAKTKSKKKTIISDKGNYVDKKFNELVGKIDKVRETEEDIHKTNNDGESDDDGAPLEASSKVELKKIVIKKQKIKKPKTIVYPFTTGKKEDTNKGEGAVDEGIVNEDENKINREKKKVSKKEKKKLKMLNESKTEEEPKTNTETSDNLQTGNESRTILKDKKNKNDGKLGQKKKQPKPKKPESELSEQEKVKLQKKRDKRQKQIERRKQFKAAKKAEEEALATTNPDNNSQNNSQNFDNKNNQKFENNSTQGQKRKLKEKDDKEHKRRKPEVKSLSMNVNGVEVKIAHYDGFPIKAEDATRLHNLRKQMISKGIPRSEITAALKLERRKAEKALTREKKKVCFNCRKSGHALSECQELIDGNNQEIIGSGICFKCGSTEHTHFECKVVRSDNFKFATCFICKEQGHISRQCPDNSRGLYPKGGACKVCGDVTHLKKDCPKYRAQQEEDTIKLNSMQFDDVEGIDGNSKSMKNIVNRKPNKIIKF